MFDTPMLHVCVMEQTHLFPFHFCNLIYGLIAHINSLLGQSSKYFSGLKYILHKSTGVLLMVILGCWVCIYILEEMVFLLFQSNWAVELIKIQL